MAAKLTYHDHCARLKPGTAGGNFKGTADRPAPAAALATFLDRLPADSTAGRATRLDLPHRFILGLVSRKRTPGIRDLQLLRFATRIRTPVHFPQEAPPQRPPGACVRWISGLASSQFKRWHLDHHDHLGSNARRPQTRASVPSHQFAVVQTALLHAMLFPIYFGSSRNLQRLSRATVPPDQTRAHSGHRPALGNPDVVLDAGPVVCFQSASFSGIFIFPIAFTVNRLGQALCDKPGRNCQLDNPHASQLDMEFSLSVFDISPGTSLFPRRAILQPAEIAKRTGTLFQRKQMVFFFLQSGALSLVYQKPRTPYAIRHHNIKQEAP